MAERRSPITPWITFALLILLLGSYVGAYYALVEIKDVRVKGYSAQGEPIYGQTENRLRETSF